jgi:outer membrane lipoprotein-sorting protein
MTKYLSFIILTLCSISVAFGQYDQKALQILDAVSLKYQKMPAFKVDFKYNLKSDAEKIDETATGSLTVKGGKYYLKMKDQEIYNDQTTVWTYLKESNEVNITNHDPKADDFTPAKIYTMYKKGFKYAFVEETTIEGKPYDVVDLTPEDRTKDIFKVRIVIDKKESTIRSYEVFEKKGRRYTFSILKLDPAVQVKDNFFQFDKAKHPNVFTVDLR